MQPRPGALVSGGFHPGNLHAAPKTRALSIPLPDQAEGLSAEELAALRAWAAEHGRTWKAALRLAWENGRYGGSEHDAELQSIRNRLGADWLARYKLSLG